MENKFIKYLKPFFCVCMIFFLLASCIVYDYYDGNGNPIYKDYYRAIQFSYPKGWKVEERNNDAGLYVVPAEYEGNTEPNIYLSVVYNEQKETENFEKNLEQYINDIKTMYVDAEIIDYGNKTNSAGNNSQYVKYKYTDSDGNHLYASDRLIFVSVLTLIGSARCDEQSMEMYDSFFDITMDTLTIFS